MPTPLHNALPELGLQQLSSHAVFATATAAASRWMAFHLRQWKHKRLQRWHDGGKSIELSGSGHVQGSDITTDRDRGGLSQGVLRLPGQSILEFPRHGSSSCSGHTNLQAQLELPEYASQHEHMRCPFGGFVFLGVRDRRECQSVAVAIQCVVRQFPKGLLSHSHFSLVQPPQHWCGSGRRESCVQTRAYGEPNRCSNGELAHGVESLLRMIMTSVLLSGHADCSSDGGSQCCSDGSSDPGTLRSAHGRI
jgi:hypothetical protein